MGKLFKFKCDLFLSMIGMIVCLGIIDSNLNFEFKFVWLVASNSEGKIIGIFKKLDSRRET